MTDIRLRPVGFVRNQSKEPAWGDALGNLAWEERAAMMKEQQKSISELVFDPDFDVALDNVEEFSHITVLYWAHLAPEERRSIKKVHPMGNKDFPLVGVFATRSPIRPNSILSTTVRLLERNGSVLKVTGLDALDGSPVLDIKPYHNGNQDGEEYRIPNWMHDIHKTFTDMSPGPGDKSSG